MAWVEAVIIVSTTIITLGHVVSQKMGCRDIIDKKFFPTSAVDDNTARLGVLKNAILIPNQVSLF